MSGTNDVDRYAQLVDAGCDYCGHRTGLERYESTRILDHGLRCVDAKSCNTRELAATDADEDDA
ncbi:MAG: hypothetical protein NUW01_13665 [Gemmatimonadaceae bacterium]|nr:hypothetical protein [Gemmatimonadaceae bacterium]